MYFICIAGKPLFIKSETHCSSVWKPGPPIAKQLLCIQTRTTAVNITSLFSPFFLHRDAAVLAVFGPRIAITFPACLAVCAFLFSRFALLAS